MNSRRGQRIRLIFTSDPYTDLPAGSEGTLQSAPTLARFTLPGTAAWPWG